MSASPTPNTQEIFKRLKIGLSLVIGFLLGKFAASFSPADYSLLFSAGFLAGAIGTQGAFRLYQLWQQKRQGILDDSAKT